ncbi:MULTISPECIES: DUF6892 domain-containing protein [unclassified Streptomyces]|uniref:DUF6892 domain-containing protein n=1 Tax=unclassified Streptomyces TaxID=2593676 RepID=UPI0004C2E32F
MSQFRDFNLKLLVIEELMYGPAPVLPVFSLSAKLAERGIDDPVDYVLENGLHEEVLPEARAHFEALEIPAELLAGVEELCFDAGADVFRHCAPAWDGEDDLFDVRSLDDLALLPNLREVTFAEDGVLAVPDAAEIFAARGIDADFD